MRTLERGILDAVPVARRRARDVAAARWAAPGLALGGTAAGALVGDACATGLALPASGFALTVAGAALWLTGLRGERRDGIALSIAVAVALLSIAALQQLFVCMLGREGMMAAELLQAGGLILLFVSLAFELERRRRARAAAAAGAHRRRRLAQTVEATAIQLGRRHGVHVVCDLSAGVEADSATEDALLRILREAIADAAGHCGASSVRVELRPGPCLSVRHDGRGSDAPRAVRPGARALA